MKKILIAMICIELCACSYPQCQITEKPATSGCKTAAPTQTALNIPDPLAHPQLPTVTAQRASQPTITYHQQPVVYTQAQPIYRASQPVITYIEAPAPHKRYALEPAPQYYYPRHELQQPESIINQPQQ